MTAARGRHNGRIAGALVGAAAMALAGCAGGETAAPFVGVPETVAIGGMPRPLSDTSIPTLPEVVVESTTTPMTPTAGARDPIRGPLVDEVLDHRVLLIGDTAMAATTPRAGGIMCDIVTELGWDVEIEAEPGRPIEFAEEVLDAVLTDEWDVVGLMFGHHLTETAADFAAGLDLALDRLADRPVILYTVAELGTEQAEVNRSIREREQSLPNVVVVDWADATNSEPDVLLENGGPALSEEGAGRLALFTAALLSRVPDGDPGTCVESLFTDDSAIVL